MADEKKESVLDMTTDVKKETKVESAEAKPAEAKPAKTETQSTVRINLSLNTIVMILSIATLVLALLTAFIACIVSNCKDSAICREIIAMTAYEVTKLCPGIEATVVIGRFGGVVVDDEIVGIEDGAVVLLYFSCKLSETAVGVCHYGFGEELLRSEASTIERKIVNERQLCVDVMVVYHCKHFFVGFRAIP